MGVSVARALRNSCENRKSPENKKSELGKDLINLSHLHGVKISKLSDQLK